MCKIIHGIFEGKPYTAFQCSCNPDDPDRLARLYLMEEYEDPTEAGLMLKQLVARDPIGRRHRKYVSLTDVSNDGRVYFRRR